MSCQPLYVIHVTEVSSDMMAMLSKNYRVAQRWTNLAHSLQLDSHIAPIRIRILLYHEDLNLCITYLLKEWESQCPNTANLGNLLSVLRENSFNDVAGQYCLSEYSVMLVTK